MRIYDLFEAPISNLEVHGMEEPGTFPDVDRRLLKTPAHIQKIIQRFDRTDYDFALYFVNQPNKSYTKSYPATDEYPGSSFFNDDWTRDLDRYAGISSPEIVQRLTGRVITPSATAINVVFLSNANTEGTVSMTPWIVAHRFGHSITDGVGRLPGEIAETLADVPKGSTYLKLYDSRNHVGPRLTLRQVMSTRSARTGSLIDGEEQEELIAQYLMTAKLTFVLPESLQHIPDAARYQAQLNQLAIRYGNLIDNVLSYCVGHVFIAI